MAFERWNESDELDEQSEAARDVAESSGASFFKTLRLAVAFVVVLAAGFAGGLFVGSHNGTSTFNNIPLIGNGLNPSPDQAASLVDFWEVWNALNQNYVITHASSTMPT